ncbi:MAG: hypothetical protein ACRCW2_13605 [Cellulosilyticaceae bacterium]
MKRKLIVGATVLAVMSLFATGSTLAYKQVQGNVTNGVNIGKVDITIVEKFDSDAATGLAPTNPSNPKRIQKEVRIENSAGEAFVRVSFVKRWGTKNVLGAFIEDPTLSTDNLILHIKEGTQWQEIDGQYYIRLGENTLSEPELSDVLLESFSFVSTGAGDNVYRGKIAQIDVVADAIQVRNQAIEQVWNVTYNESTNQFLALHD